ncbi:Wzz/FepE/Etk N-terminal domain-containing protein [Pseudomonas sp. GB2N2]
MNDHTSGTPHNPANEVDLVDLMKILWQQKILILSITLIFALAAALYAHFSKSVYVARINLDAPAINEVTALNYSGLKQFAPNEVYLLFTRELQSDRVRVDLYNDVYLPTVADHPSTIYTSAGELSGNVTVVETAPGRFTIAIQGSAPAELPKYLQGLLQQASDSAKQKMLDSLRFEVKSAVQRYDYEINASRELSKTKRLDLITRLQDALKIAEILNIEKISTFIPSDQIGNLAYLRGTRALKAEISSLQARTNDDPYIDKVRESLFQKEFLTSINVQPQDFTVFTQAGQIESLGPIKARSSFIIAIGIIFGGLIGVIIALIRCFARKQTPLR